MKRNMHLTEFPHNMWESEHFQKFDDLTQNWPASWVIEIANSIQRLGADQPGEAWAYAVESYNDAAAAIEDEGLYRDYPPYELDQFINDWVQESVLAFLIQKG